jgi:hypothetical protein
MRKTSDVNDTAFPFADDKVPFVLVLDGHAPDHRGFEHASHRDKKRELLEEAIERRDQGHEDHLLAAWPGGTRTDVFHVDDLDEALAAF